MLGIAIFIGITVGCAINLGACLIIDTWQSRKLEIAIYALLTIGFMFATNYMVSQLEGNITQQIQEQ